MKWCKLWTRAFTTGASAHSGVASLVRRMNEEHAPAGTNGRRAPTGAIADLVEHASHQTRVFSPLRSAPTVAFLPHTTHAAFPAPFHLSFVHRATANSADLLLAASMQGASRCDRVQSLGYEDLN